MPQILTPGLKHNKSTYTGSLGNLCHWLVEPIEVLGANICPGFAAAEILYHGDGSAKGVATGDMSVDRDPMAVSREETQGQRICDGHRMDPKARFESMHRPAIVKPDTALTDPLAGECEQILETLRAQLPSYYKLPILTLSDIVLSKN